eukprot:PhM_4_TR7667/c0_g1_i1/m.28456
MSMFDRRKASGDFEPELPPVPTLMRAESVTGPSVRAIARNVQYASSGDLRQQQPTPGSANTPHRTESFTHSDTMGRWSDMDVASEELLLDGHSGSSLNLGISTEQIPEAAWFRSLWSFLRHMYNFETNMLGVIPPFSPFRLWCIRVAISRTFARIVLIVIILNTVTLALDTPENEDNATIQAVVNVTDDIFFSLFALEAAIKIVAAGFVAHQRSYLRSAWNCLDFLIVMEGLIRYFVDSTNVSALRLVRVLRPLRTISRVQGMKLIVSAVFKSFSLMMDVVLFLVFFLILFAVLGLQVFNGSFRYRCVLAPNQTVDGIFVSDWTLVGNDTEIGCSDWESTARSCSTNGLMPWVAQECRNDYDNPNSLVHFDYFWTSILAVLQTISTDDWTNLMVPVMNSVSIYWSLYFVVIICLGAYFCVNLFLAVLLDEFNVLREEEQEKADATHRKRRTSTVVAAAVVTTPNATPALSPRLVNFTMESMYTSENLDAEEIDENVCYCVGNVCVMPFLGIVKPVSEVLGEQEDEPYGGTDTHSAGARSSVTTPYRGDGRRRTVLSSDARAMQDATRKLGSRNARWARIQARLRHLVLSKYFSAFMLFVTIVNLAVLASDHVNIDPKINRVFETINLTATVLFILELSLKVAALGPTLWARDRFNVVDGALVMISFVEMGISGGKGSAVSALRTLRVIRVFMYVSTRSTRARAITIGILSSFQAVTNLVLLLVLLIFTFAVLGVHLFGTIKSASKEHRLADFTTLWRSMLSCFVIVTGDAWMSIAVAIAEESGPASILYFIVLFMLGNYIIMNLFVAIIVDEFTVQDNASKTFTVWFDRYYDRTADVTDTIDADTFIQHAVASSLLPEDVVKRVAILTGLLQSDDSNFVYYVRPKPTRDDPMLSPRSLRRQLREQTAKPAPAAPPPTSQRPTPFYSLSTPTSQAVLSTSANNIPTSVLQAPLPPSVSSQQSKDAMGGRQNTTSSESLARKRRTRRVSTYISEFAAAGERVPRWLMNGGFDHLPKRRTSMDDNFVQDPMPTTATALVEPLHSSSSRANMADASNPSGEFELDSHEHQRNNEITPPTPGGVTADRDDDGDPMKDTFDELQPPPARKRTFSLTEAETQRRESLGTQVMPMGLQVDASFAEDLAQANIPMTPGGQHRSGCNPLLMHFQRVRRTYRNFFLLSNVGRDTLQGTSLLIFPPVGPGLAHRFRVFAAWLVAHIFFEVFIMIVILSSLVMLWLGPELSDEVVRPADIAFCAVFVIEMLLKWVAWGVCVVDGGKSSYLGSVVNRADGIVVLATFIALFWTPLRVVRVFRIMRVIVRSRHIRIVSRALAYSIPGVTHAFVFCVAIWFIFSILGVAFFKGIFSQCTGPVHARANCTGYYNETVVTAMGSYNVTKEMKWESFHDNFDDVGHAMLVLFKLAVKEQWTKHMFDGMDAVGDDVGPEKDGNPSAAFFFVTFIVVGNFFGTNMVVGTLLNSFQSMKAHVDGSALLTPLQRMWVKSRRVAATTAMLPRAVPPLHPKYSEKGKKLPLDRVYRYRRGVGFYECEICNEIMSDDETFDAHVRHWSHKVAVVARYIRCAAFFLCETHRRSFDFCITGLIMANVAVLACQHYSQSSEWDDALLWSNLTFLILFFIEAVIKIVAMGPKLYISSSWNKFDAFVLVVSSVAFVFGTNTAALRIVRIVRVFRLLNKFEGLQTVCTSLVISLPSFFNVLLILLVTFFVFGVIAVELFSGVRQTPDGLSRYNNFEDSGTALLTLFMMSTTENWVNVMAGCNLSPPDCDPEENNCGHWIAIPFFIFFMVLGSFIMVNLIIAVVLENFIEAQDALAMHSLATPLDTLKELWLDFDPTARKKLPSPKFLMILRTWLHDYGVCVGLGQDTQDMDFVGLMGFLEVMRVSIDENDEVAYEEVISTLFRLMFNVDIGAIMEKARAINHKRLTRIADSALTSADTWDVRHSFAQTKISRSWRRKKFLRLVKFASFRARSLKSLKSTLGGNTNDSAPPVRTQHAPDIYEDPRFRLMDTTLPMCHFLSADVVSAEGSSDLVTSDADRTSRHQSLGDDERRAPPSAAAFRGTQPNASTNNTQSGDGLGASRPTEPYATATADDEVTHHPFNVEMEERVDEPTQK